MHNFFIGATIFLALTILMCMYRVFKGPTKGDRIIGINIIGTKTVVIIAIVSTILSEDYFIDVALVYVLISFIASYAVSREIMEAREK